MLTLIAVLLGTLAVLLAVISVQLLKLNRSEVYQSGRLDDIFRAQINPRTRIGGPVAIQSGAVSEEQELERLGRASHGRRIVVGGDDDSQLNKDLAIATREEADHG